jgi:hypothetical protein
MYKDKNGRLYTKMELLLRPMTDRSLLLSVTNLYMMTHT